MKFTKDDLPDIIIDVRENQKTPGTTAILLDNGKTYLVCLVCKLKTQNKIEFLAHICIMPGDEDLI